jgi:hypothetical protein
MSTARNRAGKTQRHLLDVVEPALLFDFAEEWRQVIVGCFKEIAYTAGYRHTSSFVRAFKTHFGLSPGCLAPGATSNRRSSIRQQIATAANEIRLTSARPSNSL